MNETLDEAQQLLGAGQRDRISFHLLVETRRAPHETVGFLAQQACEKFIKSVLVLNAVRLKRTHDLEYLAQLADTHGVVLPVNTDALRCLNPYAVALRYEGSDIVWVTEEKAQELVDILYQWAEQIVGQAAQQNRSIHE